MAAGTAIVQTERNSLKFLQTNVEMYPTKVIHVFLAFSSFFWVFAPIVYAVKVKCLIVCGQGKKCTGLSCDDCPAEQFQDQKMHQRTECRDYSRRPPGQHWILKSDDSPYRDRDREYICDKGYKEHNYTSGSDSRECRPLTTTNVRPESTTKSTGGNETTGNIAKINESEANNSLSGGEIAAIVIPVIVVLILIVIQVKRKKCCLSTSHVEDPPNNEESEYFLNGQSSATTENGHGLPVTSVPLSTSHVEDPPNNEESESFLNGQSSATTENGHGLPVTSVPLSTSHVEDPPNNEESESFLNGQSSATTENGHGLPVTSVPLSTSHVEDPPNNEESESFLNGQSSATTENGHGLPVTSVPLSTSHVEDPPNNEESESFLNGQSSATTENGHGLPVTSVPLSTSHVEDPPNNEESESFLNGQNFSLGNGLKMDIWRLKYDLVTLLFQTHVQADDADRLFIALPKLKTFVPSTILSYNKQKFDSLEACKATLVEYMEKCCYSNESFKDCIIHILKITLLRIDVVEDKEFNELLENTQTYFDKLNKFTNFLWKRLNCDEISNLLSEILNLMPLKKMRIDEKEIMMRLMDSTNFIDALEESLSRIKRKDINAKRQWNELWKAQTEGSQKEKNELNE